MKKHFLLLLPLLLSSCTDGASHQASVPLFHYDPIHMEIDGNQDTMFYSLQTSELNTWIKEKRSFPLYVWSQGCGACDAFGLTLKDYVSQNNLLFPFIYLSSYVASDKSLSLDNSSLLFYQDGKVFDYWTDFSDIGSSKDLTKKLSQYVYDTQVNVINSSYVNSNLKTTFNTYSLNAALDDPKTNDTDILQIVNSSDSLPLGTTLLANDSKSFEYSSFYQGMTSKKVNYLAFVSQEITTKTQGIYSYLDKNKTFNMVTVSGDTQAFTSFDSFEEFPS